jgi:hypothetical protein
MEKIKASERRQQRLILIIENLQKELDSLTRGSLDENFWQ